MAKTIAGHLKNCVLLIGQCLFALRNGSAQKHAVHLALLIGHAKKYKSECNNMIYMWRVLLIKIQVMIKMCLIISDLSLI